MRINGLICLVLLLGLPGWSQQKAAAPKPPTQEAPGRGAEDDEKETLPQSAAAIGPDAAVITVKGLCPDSAASSASKTCETVVTRAQFERLAAAVRANAAVQKRQLATSYPRLMALAREAENRGLDKQQDFQERIAFSRLQILSQELLRNLQQEASKVPDADVEEYYRGNAGLFERATLERLTVPAIRQTEEAKGSPGPSDAQQKEKDKDAMRQEAERLRGRAAAGDDFGALQQQAYGFAHLNTPPPPTRLERARRGSVPDAHQSVFDLKAGEISPVIEDAGGFYVYKLDSKETEPLSEVQAEIRKKLEEQRMRAMMQKVQDSVSSDLNQAYFGAGKEKRRTKEIVPGDPQLALPKPD